jgi:glycine oxidase
VRILVKGAGVAGLSTAHELAAHGADVVLIEKKPSPGGGASWFAGGMLAPFCERESAEETVVALGREAATWWEETLPGTVSFTGTLVVAPSRDVAELARFAARTRGHTQVDADGIAALEPDLAGRFRSGLHYPEEAHLDPRHTLVRLHAKVTSMGVKSIFNCSEPPDADSFEAVIDCTGMAAAGFLPELRGVRGEMLYLETSEVRLSRSVRLIHPRFPVYVVPRGDGRFMVGATMVESDSDGAVTARSLMELLNAAYALHPAFGEARVIEISSGVRPAFDDNLPKVVRKGDTLFVNGLYRHGFLLAPALAQQVAKIMFAEGDEKEGTDEDRRQWRSA